MTQCKDMKKMDYEKKYKAVLETAKQWVKDGCSDKERICLECIFPELRESEDERIRSAMIRGFNSLMANQPVATFAGESIRDILAWLEKQKEQKPVEIHIENPNVQKIDPNIKIVTRTDGTGDIDGKALLHTADKSYNIGFRDGVNSVKPAEWSEDIIQKAVKEVGLTQHQIDWFKTNVFPPKQEWSEEDEDTYNQVYYLFRDAIDAWYKAVFSGCYPTITRDKVLAMLKSLRPQSHWKPSEEQMRAFKQSIEWDDERADVFDKTLQSLYIDLKNYFSL